MIIPWDSIRTVSADSVTAVVCQLWRNWVNSKDTAVNGIDVLPVTHISMSRCRVICTSAVAECDIEVAVRAEGNCPAVMIELGLVDSH